MVTSLEAPPEALRAIPPGGRHPQPGQTGSAVAPALGRAPRFPPVHRRPTLLTLASLGAWSIAPNTAWASTKGLPIPLAAAWERESSFHIGLLSTQPGAGQSLQIHASLEVPPRAHGLFVLPDGSVLATARRPGDRPGRGGARQPPPPHKLCTDREPTLHTPSIT